jgi:hypothetical protein
VLTKPASFEPPKTWHHVLLETRLDCGNQALNKRRTLRFNFVERCAWGGLATTAGADGEDGADGGAEDWGDAGANGTPESPNGQPGFDAEAVAQGGNGTAGTVAGNLDVSGFVLGTNSGVDCLSVRGGSGGKGGIATAVGGQGVNAYDGYPSRALGRCCSAASACW